MFEDDGIHLTPGPLVVVLKVAQDQNPAEPSRYWPPSEPDQIETIAASYIPPSGRNASVRMFNLAPNVKLAGMGSSAAAGGAAAGGGSMISGVHYSDSSHWIPLPPTEQQFTFYDDDLSPHESLLSSTATPTAGIGSTQFLMGLHYRESGEPLGLVSVLLQDAPEDGLCKPSSSSSASVDLPQR